MSRIDDQLQEGRLIAKLPQYRRLVAKAKADIAVFLDTAKNPYVSNSWGKQSIVMAHLVYTVAPGILNVHFTGDDAPLIANFDAVRDRFLSICPIPYTEVWRGVHLREAITEYNRDHGHDGYFVGLAAEESRGRRISCGNADGNNIMLCHKMLRCTPLARWTIRDLAAYIVANELPLLSPYIMYGLDIRTSTGCREGSFTERAIDYMSRDNAAEMKRRLEERRALHGEV